MQLRCCCNPGMLLGSLPDPTPEDLKARKKVFKTNAGNEVPIEIAQVGTSRAGFTIGDVVEALMVNNPVTVESLIKDVKVAYKSNDMPMEVFEDIPGFVKA